MHKTDKAFAIFFTILIVLIATIAIVLPFNYYSTTPDTKHNIIVKFNGEDKNIPLDGELLIIRRTVEDTVYVGIATENDAINFLEENGKG
jgi:hypothetical protein